MKELIELKKEVKEKILKKMSGLLDKDEHYNNTLLDYAKAFRLLSHRHHRRHHSKSINKKE